tara:strand:- start:533 stop:730 length:198 start_codon:yes stop_codon:yes gene_type:complete
MTYWVDEFDKKIKDKAKEDLEILYKAKSIIINRINYNDEKCAFLELQCGSDKFNKCIEIIEDELH